MKRREAFLALGATGLIGLVPTALAGAVPSADLTDQDVEALLRGVAGVEPQPGEAARVRKALLESRVGFATDPAVQPAFAFDPEVEP